MTKGQRTLAEIRLAEVNWALQDLADLRAVGDDPATTEEILKRYKRWIERALCIGRRDAG